MSGKFITIEGGEGVGKSTNIACVEQYLASRGIAFIKTREPGGTPLAEEIRELLLSARDEPFAETAELLLMFAARSQHMQHKILPALKQGLWVICDRFTDATYAYQGGGRGLSVAHIATLEALVQESLQPDLTLLLDVDVGIGLGRAANRSEPDRFESEQQAFFERIRQVYLARAAEYPARFRIVDAGQPLSVVQQSIIRVLEGFLDGCQ